MLNTAGTIPLSVVLGLCLSSFDACWGLHWSDAIRNMNNQSCKSLWHFQRLLSWWARPDYSAWGLQRYQAAPTFQMSLIFCFDSTIHWRTLLKIIRWNNTFLSNPTCHVATNLCFLDRTSGRLHNSSWFQELAYYVLPRNMNADWWSPAWEGKTYRNQKSASISNELQRGEMIKNLQTMALLHYSGHSRINGMSIWHTGQMAVLDLHNAKYHILSYFWAINHFVTVHICHHLGSLELTNPQPPSA